MDTSFTEDVVQRCRWLCDSFQRLLGRPLVVTSAGTSTLSSPQVAQALYDAEPVILAHDTRPDPVFWFANRTAQRLWDMSWEQFTALPSRLSAEADEQAARAQLLARAQRDGFIDDYQGIRISSSGRRFHIRDVIIWNIEDDQGSAVGQGATFTKWHFLDNAGRSGVVSC